MSQPESTRAERTRGRIRAAAETLFLAQGYLATSTDAIRVAAGIASKETLYRHYPTKEALFVDVLRHATLEQPGVAARLGALPPPADRAALHATLTALAREILARMCAPEYLALLRIVIAEAPRFPQMGALFFGAVPERGLALFGGLLRDAQARGIIAPVDAEAVARALLGGLLTYAVSRLVGAETGPPPVDRADALVALMMGTLLPPAAAGGKI